MIQRLNFKLYWHARIVANCNPMLFSTYNFSPYHMLYFRLPYCLALASCASTQLKTQDFVSPLLVLFTFSLLGPSHFISWRVSIPIAKESLQKMWPSLIDFGVQNQERCIGKMKGGFYRAFLGNSILYCFDIVVLLSGGQI